MFGSTAGYGCARIPVTCSYSLDPKSSGFYPDYASAFRAGLGVAGLGNGFLVKQVWAEDPAYLLY